MEKIKFGIDIGGTTVKIGRFSEDGKLLNSFEIPTRAANKGENIIPDIEKAITEETKNNGYKKEDIIGIGVTVPGAVLNDDYVAPCVNLDGFGGCNLATQITEAYKIPCKIVNDANAAALGEYAAGGGHGMKNVVFVTLGTGVGGGIILNGKLLTGVHGAAGELGHIKLYGEYDVTCGCGKKGCAEQFSSATGAVRLAKHYIAESKEDSPLKALENVTAKDIFDYAKQGDALSLRITEKYAEELARTMAITSCVVDPDIFLIGGGVSKAGQFLLDIVADKFKGYAFPACECTPIGLAELGNDAGMYGAAALFE